jgi:hypothetical protein
MPETYAERHWTLDKRVPLALILTVIVQTAGVVWWASSIANTVSSQGARLVAVENQRAGERLAVLESTIGDVRAQLNRIEAKLDRYAEKASGTP